MAAELAPSEQVAASPAEDQVVTTSKGITVASRPVLAASEDVQQKDTLSAETKQRTGAPAVQAEDQMPRINQLRAEIERLERIVIGSMFFDIDAGVQTWGVQPDDFANPTLAAICRVVADVEGRVRGPASLGEVDRRLIALPAYVAAGGLRWLADYHENFVGDPVYWRDRLREARARLDLHHNLEVLAGDIADVTASPAVIEAKVEAFTTSAREIMGSAGNRLALIDAVELISIKPPAREFVVKGIIARKTVTLLTGDGGVGKSSLALQLAECIRRGEPFLGKETVAGTTLLYSCEDDGEELHRRLHGVQRSMGAAPAVVPGRLQLAPRVGNNNALVQFNAGTGLAEPTDAFRALEATAKETRVDLLVIDTTAQTFPGNENDRASVTAYVNLLAGLALRTNAGVLLLAHPPKMQGSEYSGSTGWDGTVRARLFLRRDNTNGSPRYFLKLAKANYAAQFEVELVRDDDGVMWLVEEAPPSMADKINAHQDLARFKTIFLSALDTLTHQGRAISHSNRAPNFAPRAIIRAELGLDCSVKHLSAAMEALFKDGTIIAGAVVGKGPDRKPVYGITRSAPKPDAAPPSAADLDHNDDLEAAE